MKKLTKKHWVIISLSIVAVYGVAVGTSFFAKAKDKEEIVLREYYVTKGDITAGIDSSGILKLDTVDHRFEGEVLVEDVFVKKGQEVKKGDALALLSVEDVKEKIKELNEQLQKANMNLDQARNNKKVDALNQEKGWKETTSSTKSQYEQQKEDAVTNISRLESKKKELEAKLLELNNNINELKKLMDEKATFDSNELANDKHAENPSTVNLDELNEQVQQLTVQRDATQEQLNGINEELVTAKKQLETIESNRKKQLETESQQKSDNDSINNLTNQTHDDAITLAQLEVDRINDEIKKLQSVIDEPTLYAEIDGVVIDVNYAKDNNTLAESPGIQIGTTDKLTIVLSVGQSEIRQIKLDQKVNIMFAAYGSEEFTGYVKFRDLTAQSEGGSVAYKVTVELDATDYELLDGMTCDATFLIKEVKDVLKISNKAIQIKDGTQYVTIKHPDGTLEEKVIKTGFSDGRNSEIIEGLNEGDVVVIGG